MKTNSQNMHSLINQMDSQTQGDIKTYFGLSRGDQKKSEHRTENTRTNHATDGVCKNKEQISFFL